MTDHSVVTYGNTDIGVVDYNADAMHTTYLVTYDTTEVLLNAVNNKPYYDNDYNTSSAPGTSAPQGDDQNIAPLLKSSAPPIRDAATENQAVGITLYPIGICTGAVGYGVAHSSSSPHTLNHTVTTGKLSKILSEHYNCLYKFRHYVVINFVIMW